MATKKKTATIVDKLACNEAANIGIDVTNSLNNTSNDYRRSEALSIAVRLFTDTPFREMLEPRVVGGEIPDVPFYSLTTEIYEFLKTGKFTGYNKFLEKQKDAA